MKYVLIIGIIWILITVVILGLVVRVPIDSEERKREDEEQLEYLREYNKKKELKKHNQR